MGLVHARAALRPDAATAGLQDPPPLFPEHTLCPGFDIVSLFRPFISGSLSFAFMDLI